MNEYCCPSHMNANCFSSSYLNEMEKIVFTKSVITLHARETLLMCSIRNAMTSTVAGTRTSAWLSLQCSTAISSNHVVSVGTTVANEVEI